MQELNTKTSKNHYLSMLMGVFCPWGGSILSPPTILLSRTSVEKLNQRPSRHQASAIRNSSADSANNPLNIGVNLTPRVT